MTERSDKRVEDSEIPNLDIQLGNITLEAMRIKEWDYETARKFIIAGYTKGVIDILKPLSNFDLEAVSKVASLIRAEQVEIGEDTTDGQ